MYPTILRIGSFEITSFGVLVAIAVLVGAGVLSRETERRGLDPSVAFEAVFAGVLGGLLGAKALYVLEHAWLGEPARGLIFDRAGLSWFGGLIGGVAGGAAAFARRGIGWRNALDAAGPALAIGQAIGRIGCFLVGDDYGTPTNLPWGMAFPNGSPPTLARVHPTQLYEAGALVVLFVWLRRSPRRTDRPGRVFARYLVGAGAIRFPLEFIRPNPHLIAGLSIAQAASAVAVVAGLGWLVAIRAASRQNAVSSRQ